MSYYAVQIGRVPGVYPDWKSCNKQIHGFSGAIFKKFSTEKEALDFVNQNKSSRQAIKGMDWTSGEKTDDAKVHVSSNKPKLNLEPEHVMAYTDGSYRTEDKSYSYGAVLITPDGREEEYYGRGYDGKVAALRNVSGELLGALRAIDSAVKLGYKKITICHDYIGVSEWVKGTWQCKMPLTRDYKRMVDEYKKDIKIEFIKVKSHSGDYYNEWADRLANKA